jgi:23S rRNA (cytosine1962-C5)-methyltransferase
MHSIFLKKGKDEAVKRGHPWIFSGAVHNTVTQSVIAQDALKESLLDGDLVKVFDYKKQYLATGYYNNGSIIVRILSFENDTIDAPFWIKKVKNAFEYRQKIGLIGHIATNCYRLIHAEGDGLPGLIVDIYNQVAVIQCHAIGIHLRIDDIKNALIEVFGKQILAIYDKSSETLPPQYVSQNALKNHYIFGEMPTPYTVFENNCAFAVDWETGQKTGFFLDQRDNRQLISQYAKGKNVLNAFCYSGGFSIYALKAGAKMVHSIDISQKAIDLTLQNVGLNQPNEGQHTAEAADVMQYLKDNKNKYDLMIIDPPAFAKSIAKRHNAVQAYKRLNAMAISQITEGGILFTFSCSQVVDRDLFYNTIVAAAIEAKRQVRVMHHLTQPADHCVSLSHQEGAYLKGLVLYVE